MGEMTIALFALALVLATRARAWGQAMRYCETFEEGVPDDFSATRTESLSTSPWHYKQGSRSLRWDWRRGEEMVIRHGIGDVSRVGGFGAVAGFSVWLYMENPIPDALVFEFREGERVTGSFRFPTDFTGWKQARPHFSDFPQGKPTSAVDNIRIAAPEATSEGTAFLDFIKFNTLTHRGSAVVPEREAEWVAPVPDERRFPKPEQVTESEAAGLRKLLGPEQGEGIEDAQAEELCGLVDSLGIVRDEHGVRGPGIDAYYQFHPSADEQTALGPGYWPDEHGPDWMGMQTPGAMASLVRRVASAYRASNAAGQRQRLAERFFLIADHLHDQALQARSGFRWNWWVGGSWADALFLMRDLLAETGRLQPHLDFQLYTYGASALFDDADPPSQMDFYHLTVPSLYRQCLMQVDAAEQVRWLNAFKAMLERSMTQPTSALKIDGSAYHHNGHYHSYAKNAFGTLPPLLLSLNDTPWRLSADARERLRRAELAQRIYCNRIHVPLSLCGRSPFRKGYGYMNSHALAGLETLARCGSPDGTQAVDREVAAAYLRLSPEAAAEEPYRDFGIDPEPEPSGTFVMPYAALLCHRREDWLASVKGQSKYCWGTERQDHHNRFGLFQGMGQLEILAGGKPVNPVESGRQRAGWDWARYEGTTVPQVPLALLEEGGREGRRGYSEEPFVGGLSHRGRQGVYAMVVNQPMPRDRTLTGRKSWFFNGDQIVCLGSDITCDEAEYPTQTTLCQKGLETDDAGSFLPTPLDGGDFIEIPGERVLDAANPHWFIDVQRTGYYVPAGQPVTVTRRHQESRSSWDEEDTEGDFLTAWIDHGMAPSNASYEYMLVVRAAAEAMEKLASEPPYRILQQDRDAHIVHHKDTGRWACVFFASQDVAAHEADEQVLPVSSVDHPCLIMAEPGKGGRLDLSVADPDLNLVDDVNQPKALRVVLRGAWRLQKAKATVCQWELPDAPEDVRVLSSGAGETVLEIVCRHGASYDLTVTG